jgi:hypothetical protein
VRAGRTLAIRIAIGLKERDMRIRTVLRAVIACAFPMILTFTAAASPRYSEWSNPVNLGSAINSPYQDFAAILSKDGCSLYFSSDRPGGFGATDLWVSQRTSKDEPWGPPINLGAVVNSAAPDSLPSLSRDGHVLFLSSTRPGGYGGQDIWMSWRADVHDDFSWEPPANLGPGVNSSFLEASGSYLDGDEDGVPRLFFSSNRPGGTGAADIWVSELSAEGVFLPATVVPELSSPVADFVPSIRFDGLEIFMRRSSTAVSFDGDLWVSTRESVFDAWSVPVSVGAPVNSDAAEQHVHIAPDRETLLFSSSRPGGFGAIDIYMSTRTKNDH